MHKMYLLLAGLISLATLPLISRPTCDSLRRHRLELGLGHIQGLYRDLNFSLLNYHASGWVYSLSYENRNPGQSRILAAYLRFGTGHLKTSASARFTTDFYAGDLGLLYLRSVRMADPRLRLFLGGHLRASPQFENFLGLTSFSFLFAYDLGISGLAEYRLHSKSSVQASVSVPLVTFLVRPPYNGHDKELSDNTGNLFKLLTNGRLSSLHRYVCLTLRVQYRYALSQRLGLVCGYQLQYQHLTDTNTLINLTNQVSAGACIHL